MSFKQNKQIKNEISNEELKIEYDKKNEFMTSYFPHDELFVHQFLEELFLEGINKNLIMHDKDFNSKKANGQMYIYSPERSRYKNEKKEFAVRMKPLILTLENIYELTIEGYNGVFLSPGLYFGTGGQEYLTYFLNFDIDLDGIYTMSDLVKLIHEFENGTILKPTLLVNSGTGVHLIYRLKNPIYVHKQRPVQTFLLAIKKAICSKLNRIFPTKQEIDALSLDQKIRCVGSTTKLGEISANSVEEAKNDVVKAWRLDDSFELKELVKFSEDDLDKSFSQVITEIYKEENIETDDGISPKVKEMLKKLLVKENNSFTAHTRIVRGEKTYVRFNKNPYNGWLKKCQNVVEGKRYFALLGAAAFAIKCGVKEDDLINDLDKLKVFYNNRDTAKITEKDIYSVINSFRNKKNELICLTGKFINERCGLQANPSKRNYKTQKEHLESIKGLSGRKSKKDEVLEHFIMLKNKGKNVEKMSTRELASLSGISQSTITRHKKECIELM